MPSRKPSHWLLKTEPETYSFLTLLKEGKTHWNDVRNFQARNFLRQIRIGDLALIYHSGDEKSVVGIARIVREAYPDIDPEDDRPGDWVQVDLEAVEALPHSVSLATLKSDVTLKDLLLIRQSRLSVMPVTEKEYERILRLGQDGQEMSPRLSKPSSRKKAEK
jgi:predicted RNA-binding protein with PUA-like domain